jgi:hypothetical protein
MHYSILVGKPEGKRPLGSPRYRWEDNIFTCTGVRMTNNNGSRSVIGFVDPSLYNYI